MGLFSSDAEDEVIVSASFPESNPFGLVVNGEQNGVLIHLENPSQNNYTLVSAAASFHDPTRHWSLIKNVTAMRYNVPLMSGANFSAPFQVYSEYRPQELGLTVWVNLAESGSKDLQTITAMNQTVSIVEPASSFLDPQLIFLYLVVTAAIAGAGYAAYQAFFNDKSKKRGSGGAKKKAVVVNKKTEEYPTVKPYEEEWIPAHHLKSRTSKLKKRADGGLSSGGEELTSGGEVTSGAESGGEGLKNRKRKTKKA